MNRTEVTYALGLTADIRAWRGLAWREYTWRGEIVAESAAAGIVPAFDGDQDQAILDDIAKLTPPKHGTEVYLRFGELPKSGHSTNWATGNQEAGISVYCTQYNLSDSCYQVCGALPGAEIAYRMKGANIYFVTGDCVGTGSDGEPLLVNAKIVASATPAAHGYV